MISSICSSNTAIQQVQQNSQTRNAAPAAKQSTDEPKDTVTLSPHALAQAQAMTDADHDGDSR
jgi:hypothetical protein